MQQQLRAGRIRLTTNAAYNPTPADITADLPRVLALHAENAAEIKFLQDYYGGYHPAVLNREKATRKDIDNRIVVSYASALSRDIVGYFLGKPIQYTHRDGSMHESIRALNTIVTLENKPRIDHEIALDCSICGVGYLGVFYDERREDDNPLLLLRLDPKDTFVVYSSDPRLGPVYAGFMYSSAEDAGGQSTTELVVYTRTMQLTYTLEGGTDYGASPTLVSTRPFFYGGHLPIIEYANNHWRIGDWELAIPLMDALDFAVSDTVNDLQQAVNAILVALGVDITDDIYRQLGERAFLCVPDIPPGVDPKIEYISQPIDANITTSLRDYLESLIRIIVGVPDRKERPGGGGDTGEAVYLRDGWHDLDIVAATKEPYFIDSERAALKAILYILRLTKSITDLTPNDIEIHFNRNKSANLQSKAQVFATLIASGMHPADALDIANLTNNVNDVTMRMRQFITVAPNRQEEPALDAGADDSEAAPTV